MHQFGVALSENPAPAILPNLAKNDARWFAIYTNSRREKSVAKHFAERQIESFLPLYRKVHHWTKRSRVILELPLFPNYVFVHITPQQRVSLLAVPGVLGIVGRGHISSALSDTEIESLRTGLKLDKFEPYPYLVAGERVRIRAGSMEGMEGILVRKKNELRVVLTLDLIQRSVAVEVDAEDVEPVVSHSCLKLVPEKPHSMGSQRTMKGVLRSPHG
jgi:transcription antitermination factor NusG